MAENTMTENGEELKAIDVAEGAEQNTVAEENTATEEKAEPETTEEPEAPAPVSEKAKKEKNKKLAVVLTYVVAFLCIWAGLLAPLYNMGAADVMDKMLLRYIPYHLNNLVAPFTKSALLTNLPWFIGNDALATSFDAEALILVLYALTGILSLIMLIPVCAGKKENSTYLRCAFSVEIIAMILSAAYIITRTYNYVSVGIIGWVDYNMCVALGGTLVMACMQAIFTKGGMGVSRTLVLVFSLLSAISILDLAIFVPQLAGPLGKFSSTVGGGDKASFIGGEAVMNGLGLLGLYEIVQITDIIALFSGLSVTGIIFEVLVILIVAMVLLNLVSDIIGISTGKLLNNKGKPNKHRSYNTYALVRYILTLLLVIALIVLSFVSADISAGLYLYFLAVFTVVLFICAIIRTARDDMKVKNAREAEENAVHVAEVNILDDQFVFEDASPVQDDTVVEEAPVIYYDEDVHYIVDSPEQPVYEQPSLFGEPEHYEHYEETTYELPHEEVYEEQSYSQPYEEPVQSVYTDLDFSTFESEEQTTSDGEQLALDDPLLAPAAPVPSTVFVYGGDTDEFMETLTDAEKIEFVQVFLKKSKGSVRGIPDYKINGDNDDFFPAVFVYINRVRPMVSDNLLGKIYKQLGKI